MNEWQIQYVYEGNKCVVVRADTIDMALRRFWAENPDVPNLAVYSVICVR